MTSCHSDSVITDTKTRVVFNLRAKLRLYFEATLRLCSATSTICPQFKGRMASLRNIWAIVFLAEGVDEREMQNNAYPRAPPYSTRT